MPRYRVYVIELDRAVMHIRAFRERNPDARADKPCVYVGSTWLEPQKRFEQHKAGVKANRFARKFGVKLRERLMKHLQSYETRALAMAAGVWGVVGVRGVRLMTMSEPARNPWPRIHNRIWRYLSLGVIRTGGRETAEQNRSRTS